MSKLAAGKKKQSKKNWQINVQFEEQAGEVMTLTKARSPDPEANGYQKSQIPVVVTLTQSDNGDPVIDSDLTWSD